MQLQRCHPLRVLTCASTGSACLYCGAQVLLARVAAKLGSTRLPPATAAAAAAVARGAAASVAAELPQLAAAARRDIAAAAVKAAAHKKLLTSALHSIVGQSSRWVGVALPGSGDRAVSDAVACCSARAGGRRSQGYSTPGPSGRCATWAGSWPRRGAEGTGVREVLACRCRRSKHCVSESMHCRVERVSQIRHIVAGTCNFTARLVTSRQHGSSAAVSSRRQLESNCRAVVHTTLLGMNAGHAACAHQ